MSYVGALCIQSGYNVVQDWINQLLEPSEKRVKNEPTPLTVPSPLPQQAGAPPDVAAASQARFLNQFKSDTPTFSQLNPRASQPPPYNPSGSSSAFSNSKGLFPPQNIFEHVEAAAISNSVDDIAEHVEPVAISHSFNNTSERAILNSFVNYTFEHVEPAAVSNSFVNDIFKRSEPAATPNSFGSIFE